ncbi:excisionase family DNA-binding protein [Stenoxybacter acetivorans]|uniref:excisionase family DNA-binding protein n=1 Tax=Stenoxybacter acetivorans TaxID=422441 RepID=UPI0012EB5448|nr:excisionase family DNA-binding protein [Stenoxybacter acetivorans]
MAECTQVHKDTIRIWIRKGEIPAHKIGKLWCFKVSEVDEWVRERQKCRRQQKF